MLQRSALSAAKFFISDDMKTRIIATAQFDRETFFQNSHCILAFRLCTNHTTVLLQ